MVRPLIGVKDLPVIGVDGVGVEGELDSEKVRLAR